MKQFSSTEVITALLADGWYELKRKGTSHRQFKHPTKPGRVTVKDNEKEIHPKTLGNIEKQSGLRFRR